MHKERLVIFGPGIREHFTFAEKFMADRYKFAHTEFYRPSWRKGESLASLVQGLEDHIDRRVSEGFRVALVASSSTVSLAINADIWNSLEKAVFLCGKVKDWGPGFNPAFYISNLRNRLYTESVRNAEANLANLGFEQRRKIMTITPWYDFQAPPKTCLIEGAKNIKIPGFFHALPIACALVFMNKQIEEFIKS